MLSKCPNGRYRLNDVSIRDMNIGSTVRKVHCSLLSGTAEAGTGDEHDR